MSFCPRFSPQGIHAARGCLRPRRSQARLLCVPAPWPPPCWRRRPARRCAAGVGLLKVRTDFFTQIFRFKQNASVYAFTRQRAVSLTRPRPRVDTCTTYTLTQCLNSSDTALLVCRSRSRASCRETPLSVSHALRQK